MFDLKALTAPQKCSPAIGTPSAPIISYPLRRICDVAKEKGLGMKRRLFRLATSCVVFAAASSMTAFAQTVPPAQVPDAVLKSIKEQVQIHGEPAQEIERETKDGKLVYSVEFVKDGINEHIKFNEDGTLWDEDRRSANVSTPPALHKLPAAVLKTLEEKRSGRAIADWDEENWNGKTVYEFELRDKEQQSRLYIASDGAVTGGKPGQPDHFKGLALSKTPRVVQNKVKEVAGNAEVARIIQKKQKGEVIYKVDLRHKGHDRRLIVAENGKLVRDSEGRGAAPGEASTERVWERVTAEFADKAALLNQTPAAVRKTIMLSSGAGELKSIESEEKDGATVYNVEYEKEGRNSHIKVAENGDIIEDNRR